MNPFLDPLQEAVAGNRSWADALAAALRGAGENMGFVPSEEKKRLTEEAKSVMPQMADPAKQELARQLMMGFGTGDIGMGVMGSIKGKGSITDLGAYRAKAEEAFQREQDKAESTHTGLFDQLYPQRFTKGDRVISQGRLGTVIESGRVPWIRFVDGTETPVAEAYLRPYDPQTGITSVE